jgi:hypothetical protein
MKQESSFLKKRSKKLLSVGALALSITAANAADRPVKLQTQPPIAKDVPAMPLIDQPQDAAERKINAALKRLDADARTGIAQCKASAKEAQSQSDWARSIDAAMRGPGFLSLAITDSTDCGGAYPNVATMSIVYSLTTGNPVDWTKLLPASLTGTLALQTGADGTKMVTLASRRLFQLYLAGYQNDVTTDPGQPTCKQIMTETGADSPPAMMAWLDAKEGGLAIQFDVIHAIEACATPVVIPVDTLRQAGAAAALTDAIEAAHKAS